MDRLDDGLGKDLVDADETISLDGWGWRQVTTVKTYATALSPTATEVLQTFTRLTGFNNGSMGGSRFVIGDVISFDSSDRYSVRWDFANPGTKSIESDYQWQGNSSGYQKGNNGYVSEVLGKNGEKVGYEYDTLGRLWHVRSRWTGSSYAEDTAYTYHEETPFVKKVTHGGIEASYTYAWNTSEGPRKVTVTEPGAKETHTLFNAMEQPWRVWGNAVQPVQFVYDAVGRRTNMTTWRSGSFTGTTWPGSPGTGATTTWTPEAATGLLAEKTWADHVASPASANRNWTYTYTPLGNVATREWARFVSGTTRVKTTYAYSPSTAELTGVTYNDGTPGTSYTYKRTGAPDQVTDFTGTRTFAYRSDLQVDSEMLPSGFYGSNRTITHTYQDGSSGTVNGRPTGFQFKTGSSTVESENTFAFSATTGKIESVTGSDVTKSKFNYGYATGADWVETVTRNSGSYVRTNSLLSDRRVLDSVETKWGANIKAKYDSTFDGRGLRASVELSGTGLTTSTRTYTHGNRGELEADTGGTAYDSTWQYDLMGKRTTAVNNGSSTTYAAVVDAGKDVNQYLTITAESGLAYDADGNTIEDGVGHYRYDGENRLVTMQSKVANKTLVFDYDYLGRRVRKDVFESGQQPGLWGEYFYGMSLSGTPGAVELRTTVDFGSAAAFPAPFTNGTGFSARWHGVVTPAQTGTWTFYTDSDDGVRLWVDGKQLVNNWTDHGTQTDSGTIVLTAGRSYSIRMEYYQNGGGATAKLKWSGPGVSTPTIIPSTALRAPQTSTLFTYSGWSVTAELNGKLAARSLTKSYLWGIDFSNASGFAGGAGGLLAVYQNSAWYYPVYDPKGNIKAYLDSTGAQVVSYLFNAFGHMYAYAGPGADFSFGFATQYTDHESGLVYYGMRYYQPKHGRFINRDPIEERGGLNLYSFVGNSPSNRWDVLGLNTPPAKPVKLPKDDVIVLQEYCVTGWCEGALKVRYPGLTTWGVPTASKGKFASIRGETLEVIQRGLERLEEQGKIKDVPLDWLRRLCGDKAGRAAVEKFAAGAKIARVFDQVAAMIDPLVGGFNYRGDVFIGSNLSVLHTEVSYQTGYAGNSNQLQFAVFYEEAIESMGVSNQWVTNNSPANPRGHEPSTLDQAASELLTDQFLVSVGDPARFPRLVGRGFGGYLNRQGPPGQRQMSVTASAAAQGVKSSPGYGLKGVPEDVRNAIKHGQVLTGWDCRRVGM